MRIDSTVIEADVKYPTDAGLASSGVRVLAREGRKLARLIKREEGAGAGSLAGDGSQAAERSLARSGAARARPSRKSSS